MRDISGIQGIYRYRHGIMVSDMPDCGWLLAHPDVGVHRAGVGFEESRRLEVGAVHV